MKTTVMIIVALAVLDGTLVAQETRPVPKDSVRVFIPGCARRYIFTAGRRTEDEPGNVDIPEGMHVRMNGPKKVMAEIKAHEGSMIEVSGLMKRGQFKPAGVGIGGVVRMAPGPDAMGGSLSGNPGVSQIMLDVEGWRPLAGNCPSR